MAKRNKRRDFEVILFIVCILLAGVIFIANNESFSLPNGYGFITTSSTSTTTTTTTRYISDDEIPDYEGEKYIVLNGNKPHFSDSSYEYTDSFEMYSELDSLGRCGTAYANIGIDIMPTEERQGIGSVKPSGWHTIKYDIVPGKYLYNRCHLIGFQLAGENANKNNLITCTRTMNTETMLYFENIVAKYVKDTNNHVLYRVTPVYDGDNLLAKGVQIEASSLEDKCDKVCYNVFVYNVQEGIEIDYTNGESKLKE